MIKKITAAAAFAAMAAYSGGASAADLGKGVREEPYFAPASNPILDANNQLSVHFAGVHFDYGETVNGLPFSEESGWVPGFGVSLSYMGKLVLPNLYLSAQFARYTGETDYLGARQGQPFGTLKGKSDADVLDWDFRFGKGFELGRSVMLTPYFGLGYHEWDRGVNTGELYSHGYYGGGLMLQVAPTDKLVITGTGLIGSTFGSEIDIATIPGAIVGSTLELGDSTIYRFGVSADYALSRNWHLNAGVEWVNFEYGRSNLDPTGTYLEPDSETTNVIVKVGLGYSFAPTYAEPLK